MAPGSSLISLSNPLATAEQLAKYNERLSRSYDTNAAQFAVFTESQLTLAAGLLLRLPVEVAAKAIIALHRYWLQKEDVQEFHGKSRSSAALYLMAKLSFTPVSPRSIINVYAFLLNSKASPLWFANRAEPMKDADPKTYFVSEGEYERQMQHLFTVENEILTMIGFDTHVVLPHAIALTYLQALGVSTDKVARRVLGHLNGALLSPQFLYLTHQPNALAVAAIYLAARETDTKLVDGNWWEVFDVDREDLGFLVLAYSSLQSFAETERKKCTDRPDRHDAEI